MGTNDHDLSIVLLKLIKETKRYIKWNWMARYISASKIIATYSWIPLIKKRQQQQQREVLHFKDSVSDANSSGVCRTTFQNSTNMLQRCIKFAIYWLELSPFWYLSSNIESKSIFSALKFDQSRSIWINLWLSLFFFFRHVCICYLSRDIERPSLSGGGRGEICHLCSLVLAHTVPRIFSNGFERLLEGVFGGMLYALKTSFAHLRSHWLFTTGHRSHFEFFQASHFHVFFFFLLLT